MGKDREGRFHPRKGKPSAPLGDESTGLKPVNSGDFEDNLEIAEKYTVGEEEPAPNLRVRHRNRNVDKREERQQERSSMHNTKAKRETFKTELSDTAPQQLLTAMPKALFADLANYKSSCCLSGYMLTHRSGVEVNEGMDSVSFKNMLQQMTAMLKQKNVEQTEIEKMLKPGYDLLRDDSFWYQMFSGLAVFIADGFFRYMKLPMRPKEEVVINSSFYLSPLLPLMANADYFYLLVLSKKQARLYRADAFGMNYIRVDELPRGVDDVVHFEEKDDQKLWRTGSGGAGGGANYHGIGAGKPDDKENLAMYFDEVDETLWKAVLSTENVPLLLAGVEYLIPIYRSVAQYKPIWNEAITGNYEHADHHALYQVARKKMESYFDERHARALEDYANQSATALTSSIPEDVIPAAHYKRVWHLFIQKDAHLWGTFDEMNNKLILHETQQEGDEDLIDKSIIKTIASAGEVHILPKERMPGKSVMAALMRYTQ